MSSRLNHSEIARHFYGSPGAVTSRARKAGSTGADAAEGPSLPELTASGRYIVREAKKILSATAIEASSPERLPDDEVISLIHELEEREGEELSERERRAVLVSLQTSLEHYSLLTPLIENPEVNDILIRAYDDISVQTNRRNFQTDLRFPDEETYRAFVEHLLKRAGKACTAGSPLVDASPDPHIRVCASHETLSPPGSGPMLTIRISRQEYISLEALVHHQMAPQAIVDYLSSVVAAGSFSVLIAGEVGTGKTTLLRALASRIPEDEAILTIEDTHEIVLRRKFVRTLVTREANAEGAGRISPAMAIRTGMRMAMNRLILGEMRDAEAAEAFIDVCASGHAGMSTIHARSARDAISRLELFLARSQGATHIDTIRRQIANAVSVVVYLGVDPATNQRRVLDILEIGGYSDGAIQLSPMFRYQARDRIPQWRRESGISRLSHDAPVSRGRAEASPSESLPCPGEILGFDPETLYRGGFE